MFKVVCVFQHSMYNAHGTLTIIADPRAERGRFSTVRRSWHTVHFPARTERPRRSPSGVTISSMEYSEGNSTVPRARCTRARFAGSTVRPVKTLLSVGLWFTAFVGSVGYLWESRRRRYGRRRPNRPAPANRREISRYRSSPVLRSTADSDPEG